MFYISLKKTPNQNATVGLYGTEAKYVFTTGKSALHIPLRRN